jgi:hypothetical protein
MPVFKRGLTRAVVISSSGITPGRIVHSNEPRQREQSRPSCVVAARYDVLRATASNVHLGLAVLENALTPASSAIRPAKSK